jgi:DNA-binding NtrC family response regulator
MLRLVAIDDDQQTLELLRAALKQSDLDIIVASEPLEGLEAIKRYHPQVVLLDLMLPNLNGMQVLDRIMAHDPEIDVIVITAHYSSESAVLAIQRGACDYFDKPLSIERLRRRVAELLLEARKRIQARFLEHELMKSYSFEGIIGRSPLMLEALAKIRRVAPHFRILLLTGATGTGKELAARALHHLSPAAKGPFVVCNCAALPAELIESELFGYLRGAFTGANADKAGLFETANGGTMFLDEIGELPLVSQPKLLRAIQHQEVQRLGSTSVRKLNVRFVGATNRDLRELVAAKAFREDLFFRLSMVEIQLPQLAERKEDLSLLIQHFIERFSTAYGKRIDGMTRRAEAVLGQYSWPGNIRELENVIGYACMITDSAVIDVNHLPENLKSPNPRPGSSFEVVSLEEIQRIHARRMLDYFGGNKTRTAELLGVSRSTLYRLLSNESEAKERSTNNEAATAGA